MSLKSLPPRSIGDGVDDGVYGESWMWYWVKWAIIAGVFVLLLAFFLGGFYHAKRRMTRGLPLLTYHRWLVPRGQRTRYEAGMHPQENNRAYYGSYPMYPSGPPPPAYNPEYDYVPPYAPPQGSSKVNPNQQANVQEQEVGATQGEQSSYGPPSYPPPGRSEGSELRVGPSQPLRAASPFGK